MEHRDILRPDPQRAILDTPFESPAEHDFACALVKWLAPDVGISKQVPVTTERGNFRLDFVLKRPGERLAIEVDGRPYHHYYRDYARDAFVLAASHADEVVRIAARGVAYHLDDVLYLLSEMHPPFFSHRGRENLRVLSTPYARRGGEWIGDAVWVYYPLPEYDPDLRESDDTVEYDGPPTSPLERDLRVLGRVTGEEFLGLEIYRRETGFAEAFLAYARSHPGDSLERLADGDWHGSRLL